MIGRALIATVCVFAASAAGCGITDVGEPLTIEVTADPPSASVGDTIRFDVSGSGALMSGFRMEYDDGSEPDEFVTGGSNSATTTFTHGYADAGTYEAVATIFDSSGVLSDTVEVIIEDE